MRLPIFIMSKDRPLFLKTYLESLERTYLDITVFWKAGEIFQPAYAELKAAYPDVVFQEEKIPLKDALSEWTMAKDEGDNGIGMITVDDNVSCAPWKPEVIIDAMSYPTLFGFSLRLHPGIAKQNNDSKPNRSGVMFYNPSTMRTHWEYVWEMSSSFYRMRDIRRVVFASRCETINQVEGKGMELFKGKVTKMACYDYAPLFNIYVDTHRNVKLEKEHAMTNEEALKLYQDGAELDVERYTRFRDQHGVTHVMRIFLK